MKKLATLLNLILCFELILMPMDQSLFAIESAEANSCGQGQQWDSNLGRCLTDVETAKVMQATASCEPKDIECYKKNAQAAFDKDVAGGKASHSKKDNKFISTVGNAGAIAAALYYGVTWFKNKESIGRCAAFSYGLIVGGGVTAAVGEIFANSKHKKNLKSIEKEWEKIVNTNFDGTDKDSKKAHSSAAQSEAFEMLAKAEDSIADNAKTKQKIYTAAALMFSGAAIAAGLEMWRPDGGICASSASLDQTHKKSMYASNHYDLFPSLSSQDSFKDYLSFNNKRAYLETNVVKNEFESIYTIFNSELDSNLSPTIADYEKSSLILPFSEESKLTIKDALVTILLNVSPIPFAHANGGEVIASTGNSTATEKGFSLKDPVARLGVSALLAGWSLIMVKHTKSQAEASTNRAEHLRKMKADFEGAASAINMCLPEDRSNTGKPECYCYTPEGQRNPSRGNSQICQKLWSSNLAGANSYKDSSNAFTGCINSKNEHDASCACKKSSKGCLSVSTKGVNGISTGALSLISSGISPLNDIASGNFAKATANDAANLNSAMRNISAVEKMIDSPKFQKQKDNIKKHMKMAENQAHKGAGSTPYSPLANNFSGNAGQAVASLEKEIEDKSPEFKATAASPTTTGSTSKKSKGFDFDFGNEANQESTSEQVSQAMNQQYDYAQNDINQSQTNLFELLSNRYQRSGMRRLFDDEGTTAPEAASNTDIND